ncbi:hypothetical protein [Paremcibacter congregatus]|uniref:hypothetical protein n=1 Tax=Paremcibacter congregatus TaxID=2043170 RepID=UPI0030EB4569|tara:strand:- start:178 stop:588 length:411 start_codon:yes stop_codon:yes gene_type:complete
MEEIIESFIKIHLLRDVRAAAYEAIDGAAEVERLKYITTGAGQSLTYGRKEQEARDYQAAPSPAPENFPFLTTQSTMTGQTLTEVAADIITASDAWLQIGAWIEGRRMKAKIDIAAATTRSEITTILEQIDWSLPE